MLLFDKLIDDDKPIDVEESLAKFSLVYLIP